MAAALRTKEFVMLVSRPGHSVTEPVMANRCLIGDVRPLNEHMSYEWPHGRVAYCVYQGLFSGHALGGRKARRYFDHTTVHHSKMVYPVSVEK